jgi:hypothetical protein
VFRVRHLLPISPDLVERIERAALAGKDVLGGLAPDEGLRLGVVQQQIVVDRALRALRDLPALIFQPLGSVVACKAVLRDYGRLSFGGFYGCRTNSMPIIVTRSRSRSIG